MRALTISRLGLILQRHSILATQEYGIPKYQRDKPQQIQKTAAETSYHHILTGSFFHACSILTPSRVACE